MGAAQNITTKWESMFQKNTWAKYPSEEMIRFVQRTFGQHPDRSKIHFLDLGCGNGTTCWYLSREGFTVDGIDGSETALGFAKAMLTEERLHANFQLGLMQELPYQDKTFNAIVDNASVTSLPLVTMKDVADEVKRVLAPGGWYYGVYFGPETTIEGERNLPEDPAFYSKLTHGPVKKAPTVRIFEESELRNIFGFLDDLAIDYTLRTVFNRKEQVQQWVVTGHMPE